MPAPRKPRKPTSATHKQASSTRKSGNSKSEAKPTVAFGRDICNDLDAAEQREWLVTNGTGGFASGTIAGSATRRYHGLLIAALTPPSGRTLLVANLDETVTLDGKSYPLASHRWTSGAIAPEGYLHIAEFRLEGLIPIWTYQIGSARMEKRIWMRDGANTTFVQYHLLNASPPIDLNLKALINYRDFHSATHAGDWRMRIERVEQGIVVTAFDGAIPFYVRSTDATCEPKHIWYRDFFYARERERGLDDREDHLFAALFSARLDAGNSVTIVFSTESTPLLEIPIARSNENRRQGRLLAAAKSLLEPAESQDRPPCLAQLVLAADQFLVKRELPGQPNGKSLIAGYHWFGDWGRDTMIALPGIALATGKFDCAKQILLAFSRLVDSGLLPNQFPNSAAALEYNTIDATLWYFEAIRQYFAATQDLPTLKKLFPVLAEIINAHLKGTRYNIHVDPADGLLYGGGPGIQLTWMDSKIGDWVVTPRTGKPIEINALWINALEDMSQFAGMLGSSRELYQQLSGKAKINFQKFWNANRNCCFDVLDSPGVGSDPTLRPNQIFAVSLSENLLSPDQRKAIVDVCASQLLTPVGLRSLAPCEPGYSGRYAGGPSDRDAVYHQGTVWGWLLGPFALAHFSVYKDRAAALQVLKPLAKFIDSYGIGTLGEIFEGDAPHRACGAVSQAWTVGEILRAWRELNRPST